MGMVTKVTLNNDFRVSRLTEIPIIIVTTLIDNKEAQTIYEKQKFLIKF